MHVQMAAEKLAMKQALEAANKKQGQLEEAINDRNAKLVSHKVRMHPRIHPCHPPEKPALLLTCQALGQGYCSTHDFQGRR